MSNKQILNLIAAFMLFLIGEEYLSKYLFEYAGANLLVIIFLMSFIVYISSD